MEKRKSGFDGQRVVYIPRPLLEKQCRKDTVLSSLYITQAGRIPSAANQYVNRPVGADHHILLFCIAGSGFANLEGTGIALKSGDFVLLPGNRAHFYGSGEKDPWTVYRIHFRGSSSHALMNYLINRIGGYKGTAARTGSVIPMIERILGWLEMGYDPENLRAVSQVLPHLLLSLCDRLEGDYSTGEVRSDPVARAAAFMRDHAESHVTIEEIARAADLSVSRFTTVFRKTTGYAPIEYFNQLKIQKACNYLDYPEMKIREVAQKLGISDPYYFSRLFTSIMGISPTTFRLES